MECCFRLSEKIGNIHDGFGNYSLTSKCSWLIDAPNSTITLHIEEFATECGWDHLYVYDGDSVESPLLAVFSGLMYKSAYSVRRVPEIVANSGTVLLHFFSDDAYNMSGFNITYRLDDCPTMVRKRYRVTNGYDLLEISYELNTYYFDILYGSYGEINCLMKRF